MTALRQRMIEDMQQHSYAERKQDSYLRAVRQLAAYFNKPPDQINEEELHQYWATHRDCVIHMPPICWKAG
jgi:integrase/recombinase XerD